MNFTHLAAGDAIFLDANTLIYHFAPDPVFGPACDHLLHRIHNQEIQGFTSTHMLSEVAHRLMTIEASNLFGWPFTGIAYRLKANPAEFQKLQAFRQAIETILNSKIQVLQIPPALVLAATTVSQTTGLLSNDALIVSVMQAHGLTKLASNDTDFDRVPGLTRYGPA
jgi:predicted nucleic acid-binding protein